MFSTLLCRSNPRSAATLCDVFASCSVFQREAASLGVLTTCMSLLEDDSSAVKLATASLLSELAGHSSGAKSRLAVGKTTGFSQTPEKVGFGLCCVYLGGWWVGGGDGGGGGWGVWSCCAACAAGIRPTML